MKECKIELMELILTNCEVAPNGQIDSITKNDIKNFNNGEHTSQEKYDFIVGISKKPMTEVSKFIINLCSLDKYYKRPE